jgi:hypothetical protein
MGHVRLGRHWRGWETGTREVGRLMEVFGKENQESKFDWDVVL